MQVQTRGAFGGLGIEVTLESGVVKVVSPIDDTPAFRAGLQAGDYITHLDGEPITGMTLADAVDKMRGPVGSVITLTVVCGQGAPFEVTLTRDVIQVQPVRQEIRHYIAYIRLTILHKQPSVALNQAADDIRSQLGEQRTAYGQDLRTIP